MKHGWYSEKMMQRLREGDAFGDGKQPHPHIWSTPDGTEVAVTNVNDSETESGIGWGDAVYVGPIVKHLGNRPLKLGP